MTGAGRRVAGAVLLLALVAAGVFFASWLSFRHSLLSRVVDQGACATTDHVTLPPPTPPGSRELFRADAACRAQVVAMLRAASGYACRRAGSLHVCEHPLNAVDDPTYVRAVIGRGHVLLETIPT